jgi:protein TonB
MSDPRDRDNDPNAPLPPGEPRRKGVSPLVWILLLLALAALGWWFYNRSVQTGVDTTAPPMTNQPAIGSEQEAAAAAERERAAANEARRAEREAQAAREREAAVPADRALSPLARVQPEYPPAAFRAGEEGTVLLRVDVDPAGKPTNVSVARRSSSRELDRAAEQAVMKWTFTPATKDGKAVASSAVIPVEFRLDSQ